MTPPQAPVSVAGPSATAPARNLASPHGPLPALLMVLTMVTGFVDAVSYLCLGHVFVANMTGNIAFLGFAVADARDFSIAASLTATAAFLAGALAGGRLGASLGAHRGRLLAMAIVLEIVAVTAAFVDVSSSADLHGEGLRYRLIVLLALAMGLQNATARRIGVPDLSTTVLTLTLTGLAADSTVAGGSNPRPGRRLLATFTMFIGAAIGTFIIFRLGVAAVLGLTLLVLLGVGIRALALSRSTQDWTGPA